MRGNEGFSTVLASQNARARNAGADTIRKYTKISEIRDGCFTRYAIISQILRKVVRPSFGKAFLRSLGNLEALRWRQAVLHCWAMSSKLLPFVLIVGTAAARAQMAPDAPDKLKPPAGEQVVFQTHATGVQIYACQQSADGKYGWTLKGPEAELHDDHGAVVGRHFAGPTWKHNDGSEVMGKMAAKVDAPDGNSIPWLLLSATSHNGEGVFAKVTSIQRLHTRGGKAPADSECTAAKVNSETRSDYAADYYFFAPGK